MEKFKNLCRWLKFNSYKPKTTKLILIDYLQDKICKYSNQEGTPAEQIKGMNRLLKDVISLKNADFEG